MRSASKERHISGGEQIARAAGRAGAAARDFFGATVYTNLPDDALERIIVVFRGYSAIPGEVADFS